ncbi:acetyltransferase [Marinomonas mediterranea]|nr:acetyltransferase [Marinomonas mediterranea]WCN15405.1 acetyltransferase [Marinomonas mediterranea]WCN19464.1 acetyltransferase [Marinomonas mediterranea MMB-1]
MRDISIRFEKEDRGRTYFIVDDACILLAYFTLTTKEVTLSAAASKSQKKTLKASSDTLKVKAHLIGQIGKNENVRDNPINLKLILEEAYCIIDQARQLIGGRVIILECENKLVQLYEKHGFKVLQTSPDIKDNTLITMFDVIKAQN